MDHGDIRAAIAEQFPELVGLDVERLGEGTDNRAFLVGHRYVFRFPKRDEVAVALAREVALLPRLAMHVPLSIPAYRFVGRSASGRLFAGYEMLNGALGSEHELSEADELQVGRDLGEFLRALHERGEVIERDGGLVEGSSLEHWREHARADLELVSGYLEPAVIAETCAAIASLPHPWDGPPTLVHGDLAAEHVLLDASLRPTGVIDWTDMMWSDPAIDLAGLVHWGGETMALAALETYPTDDPEILSRATWLARCRALADLAFGHTQGRPDYVDVGRRSLARLPHR